jgi:uncharacterized membrane protein YhaH (DUF805 family)
MGWVRLLFSFKGRAGRAKYLVVELALLTLWFTLWIVLRAEFASPWEQWVTAIPMIWINLAITSKRLHDRNRNGWWAVAVFVVNRLSYVFYGLLLGVSFGIGIDISIAEELLFALLAVTVSLLQTWVVIELFFVAGTDGPNRFGPDPTRATPRSPIDSHPGPAGIPDFLVSRTAPPPA